MVYRLVTFFILVFFASHLPGQGELPRYKLTVGEKYFIQQTMNQNTQSESGEMEGHVSLDIISKIEFEIVSISENNNYRLKTRYLELELNFFSPQTDLSLSSKSDAFSPMRGYLKELKKKSFVVIMSPYGEFLEVLKLDSIINSFFYEKSFVAEKHDLIIKTVQEAFGAEALKSIANIAMNVYNEDSPRNCIKETSINFNAKPIEISNNLFYQKIPGEKIRVQGIGVISELDESYELKDMLMETNLNGSQTYDYLFNAKNGWIIEGMSKQRIQSISSISGNPDLPAGLRIPSFTESEYTFSGGKILAKKQAVK